MGWLWMILSRVHLQRCLWTLGLLTQPTGTYADFKALRTAPQVRLTRLLNGSLLSL